MVHKTKRPIKTEESTSSRRLIGQTELETEEKDLGKDGSRS